PRLQGTARLSRAPVPLPASRARERSRGAGPGRLSGWRHERGLRDNMSLRGAAPRRAGRLRGYRYHPAMKSFVLMGIALLLNLAAAAAPGDFLSDLYRQTNAVRAEHGAPPVREGLRLGIAAQQHAEEMAALGYFS